MTKLTNLLSEVFDEQPKVDKHKVIEGVKGYGKIGQSLFNNNNIMEVAKQLAEIAESAHSHILGEQGDWFDKVSVNKNMGILKNSVKEFKKTATEAHQLNQRLQGIYEDMGHVLGRYYEIDEHVLSEEKPGGDVGTPHQPDYAPDKKEIEEREGIIPDYMQGKEGWIPDYLQGKEGWIPDYLQGKPQDPKTGATVAQPVDTTMAGSYGTKAGEVAKIGARLGADAAAGGATFDDGVQLGQMIRSGELDMDDLRHTGYDHGWVSQEGVEESADARLLKLAGITKEAVEANKPTKRLKDIKGAGVVTPGAVGGLNKKF